MHLCGNDRQTQSNRVWKVDYWYVLWLLYGIKYGVRMISNKSLLCKVCFYDCVIILLNPTKENCPCLLLGLNTIIEYKKNVNLETDITFISEHYHIFVGDLSPEIETQTLREAFLPFGEIS